MLYPEFRYRGYKSALNSKTLIGDVDEIVVPDDGEFYESIYRFDDSVLALDSLASVPKGTRFYADYLVFDLDKSDDLPLAWADTLTLCKSLDDIEARYEVWFSGRKGFHVLVPTSQFEFEPTDDEGILKRMAEAIAGELPTWDESVYNVTRILRAPFSYNEKGERWKVPVQLWMDLEAVLYKAETKDWEHIPLVFAPVNEALVQLYQACKVRVNRTIQESITEWTGSLLIPAPEGKRNETAYKIARKLARRAVPKDDVEFILSAWNKTKLEKPLPVSEIHKVVDSAFKQGANEIVEDGTYQNHLYDIRTLLRSAHQSYQDRGKGGFQTGYEFLDEYTGGFQKGEVIFWVARPGTFKTAILTNILARGSQIAQKPALFFEMEMNKETFAPRLIQMSHDCSRREAIDWLETYENSEKAQEFFRYIKTCHLSNLTTEMMVGLIDYYLETFGELSAVGIDYLSLFKGCANDSSKTAKQATEIKTVIAKAADCPVFCLVQASRNFEGNAGDMEVSRTAGKDSSYIEDSADYMIGSWLHPVEMNGEEERLVFGRFLKSRGYMSDKFKENPYFGVALDKRAMLVRDIVYVENPPKFRQPGESNED